METLIRLSTAHAKARLSKNVTAEDAHAAIELVQFAYFKRVLEKEKRKRRRHDSEESTQDDEQPEKQKRTKKAARGDQDPYDFGSDDDSHIDEAAQRVTRAQVKASGSSLPSGSGKQSEDSDQTVVPEAPATITEGRYVFELRQIFRPLYYILYGFRLKVFRTLLHKLFQQQRAQSLPLSRVREYINGEQSEEFTSGEITAAINKMSDANQIMAADDNIFLM